MSDIQDGLDIQELLNTGLTVSLKIRSCVSGIDIPSYILERPIFYLDIGYNTDVPIPDLTLTEDGISCTLSFRDVPYKCFIPIDAIVGVGGPAADMLLNNMVPKKKERPSWLRIIK